ncbi:hypothetical protein PF004_g10590 [Phytophthora fragariae]|nr:hypothetical protein PF003_g26927 [Phytophthora fragariae]KAE9230060.1 hypothetical protein PF004_g10590 [Phytophthora fragariae]
MGSANPLKRAAIHKKKRRKSGGTPERVCSLMLAKLQDIMRILGCDDEERLAEWSALKKIPLEILDQAATYAIQLLAKLITSVSGSSMTPPEERRTLIRMVGELVVADDDGLTLGGGPT